MNLTTTYYLRLLLLAILAVSSLTSLAIPRVTIAPAPDWKVAVKAGGRALSAKEFTEGYYNALVDLQTHAERQAHYTHIIREIKTTEGVQNGSQVSVYFNPAYEQLTFHHVLLYRSGKATEKLREDAFKVVPIEAERDRFIYNDAYVATLLLDDVRPGDRIEYDFTVTGANPVFGGRFTNDFYFSSPDMLPHRHQVLLVSPARKLTFRDFNKPPQSQISSRNGLTVYEWDAYNLKSPVKEAYEPDWNNTEAHVQISEYNSWQDVVNWALLMYKVPVASNSLLTLVADWKRQAKGNSLEYAQLATKFVQNDVRYMGIEIGEFSHRPHNPTQVVRQRYGDCKDKALLLCTLLRANQIEAYPALTNTYTGTQTNQFLPSPTAFNHAIVRARAGETIYWVDPTIAHQRSVDGAFNVPPYGTALVLKSGETALQPVRSTRPGKIDITETFIVPSPRIPEAIGKFQVKTVYSFNQADKMRAQLAGSSLATLEKAYLDFYKDNYKQRLVGLLDSLRIQDSASVNILTGYEGYSMINSWEMDSTSGVAAFNVVGRIFYDNFHQLSAEKRYQPIALSFPYEMAYEINLKLPEPWSIDADQWAIKRDAYELSYNRVYNPADSTLRLHYHYKALADHLPASAADAYRADVKKITTELDYQLTFNRELAAQEGHVHPGVILFFLIALGGFGYLNWCWFHYSLPTTPDVAEPRAIGGWLVLLAFSVFGAPLVISYQLLTTPIFIDSSTWSALLAAVSLKAALVQLWIYIEGLLNLLLLSYSVLCAVLFVQRRNTFPALYIFLLTGRIAFFLVDTLVVGQFFGIPVNGIVNSDFSQTIIAAVVWIPYLNRSTRVRQTFVEPLVNHQTKTRILDEPTAGQSVAGLTVALPDTDESLADEPAE